MMTFSPAMMSSKLRSRNLSRMLATSSPEKAMGPRALRVAPVPASVIFPSPLTATVTVPATDPALIAALTAVWSALLRSVRLAKAEVSLAGRNTMPLFVPSVTTKVTLSVRRPFVGTTVSSASGVLERACVSVPNPSGSAKEGAAISQFGLFAVRSRFASSAEIPPSGVDGSTSR